MDILLIMAPSTKIQKTTVMLGEYLDNKVNRDVLHRNITHLCKNLRDTSELCEMMSGVFTFINDAIKKYNQNDINADIRLSTELNEFKNILELATKYPEQYLSINHAATIDELFSNTIDALHDNQPTSDQTQKKKLLNALEIAREICSLLTSPENIAITNLYEHFTKDALSGLDSTLSPRKRMDTLFEHHQNTGRIFQEIIDIKNNKDLEKEILELRDKLRITKEIQKIAESPEGATGFGEWIEKNKKTYSRFLQQTPDDHEIKKQLIEYQQKLENHSYKNIARGLIKTGMRWLSPLAQGFNIVAPESITSAFKTNEHLAKKNLLILAQQEVERLIKEINQKEADVESAIQSVTADKSFQEIIRKASSAELVGLKNHINDVKNDISKVRNIDDEMQRIFANFQKASRQENGKHSFIHALAQRFENFLLKFEKYRAYLKKSGDKILQECTRSLNELVYELPNKIPYKYREILALHVNLQQIPIYNYRKFKKEIRRIRENRKAATKEEQQPNPSNVQLRKN